MKQGKTALGPIYKSTPGVKRGCGFRMQGGVYFECGLSPYGVPVEHYIMDLPHRFEVDSKVGCQLWEDPRTGFFHVVDYVGKKYYPEAADFIEEGRAFGFSRRVSDKFPFEYLSKESRLLLIHERGILENPEDFGGLPDGIHERLCAKFRRAEMRKDPDVVGKPRMHIDHKDLPCNAYHYAAVKPHVVQAYDETGKALGSLHFEEPPPPVVASRKAQDEYPDTSAISFARTVGNLHYAIFPNPNLERPDEDWIYAKWSSALIVSLPITNISVIRANDGSHIRTYDKVRGRANGQMHVTESEA